MKLGSFAPVIGTCAILAAIFGLSAPNRAMAQGPAGTWPHAGMLRYPEVSDPQIDTAIKHLLEELKRNRYSPPKRPAYPNRSGFGLPPRDR